ncbi:T9SS type A sorting domain-containing protein [Flavobacterium nackdongense]|uniref:T9SS type A sorting domain-containing protein n=1 Tax=Flavobacterium nackdongense TaxID=2547394 RepID=A0A4P6YD30_9FLAO|nr:T9SS type A sorting domain-containing protein [Flavobacterium nackdongense]QBN18635.1 T9SS type A sorting domain-containing protein [Flavobacterium nackdongense]
MRTTLQQLGLLILPIFAFAQYGVLDTSFDLDGKKYFGFATPNDYGEFVLVQPDNKIIVGGRSSLTGGALSFSLARLNSSGSFDSSFGTSGKVTTSYGTEGFEAISGALQQDGKIVVAGNSFTNASLGYSQIAVVRYNANGSLDTTFDSDGLVFTQIPTSNEDFAKAVKIQPDGKIVVGIQTKVNSNLDFALLRYNSDGSLDTTFDSDGIVRTISPKTEAVYDIAIQNDGKIVAVGYQSNANDDIYVARYLPDGSLDASFGSSGFFKYDFASNHNYATAVAIASDTKIVIGGRYQNGAIFSSFVARLNSNGTFDTSFDLDGIVIQTTDETISDVLVQSDNKIITAGTSNGKFGVWKLNTSGVFESTFGNSGKVETVVNINTCFANSVALQPDSKIVVVGSTYGSPFTKYGVVRYTNDVPLSTNSSFAGKAEIYPNPSTGNFNIQIDENSIGSKCTIYNLLGQKIKDFELKSTTTNQTVNKGIYLLEIEKEGNKTTKKLMVN